MGAEYLLNYNPYASDQSQIFNNLLEPNQKIQVGDTFQYHYGIQTTNLSLSSGLDYNSKGWNVFGDFSGGYRSYLREGFFQNGSYPEDSFGKGEAQRFVTLSVKAGLGYALTGRHHFTLQAQWQQNPTAHKNVCVNPRENRFTVPESSFETNTQFVFSYLWQGQAVTIKTNVYAIKRKDIQEVSFYFADGIGGDQALLFKKLYRGFGSITLDLKAVWR